MTSSELKRGKLFSFAASLCLIFSRELLQWQNPVLAASEKLVKLAAALRSYSLQQTTW
ncbi:MAG TPA: hypothetical protein VGI13_17335 [Candidatus Acidoferrum sp.]